MSRVRVAAKLTGILGGLLAVPVVLYATVGNPLPAIPIDWGLVAESLATGAVTTGTWLKVVAVGGWFLWCYLVAAVAVEVVAMVRGRASRSRAMPVRWLASTIVALATQLATVSVPAAITPTPAVAFAVVDDTLHVPGIEPHQQVGVPSGTRLVLASEGDSWAGFATREAGDPAAADTIRQLNHGRDVGGHVIDGSEPFVEAGWQLAIPTSDSETIGPAAATREMPSSVEPDEINEASWTVKPGEHFWAIAQHTLADAWGRAPSDAEMIPYWRELIEHNRDRLKPPHDPNLIFPGQEFVLPPTPADPTGETSPAGNGRVMEPDEPPPRLDEPTGDVDPAPSPEPPPDAEMEQPPDAITDGHDVKPEEQTPIEPDDALTPPEGEVVRTAWGTPVALAAGTAAAMMLAGGVLAVVHRRRRIALQQRPVQVRLPPLTAEQAAQMARLEAAAPDEEALDNLAALLSSIPEQVVPMLVELDDDGTVRLAFSAGHLPDDIPPPPWAAEPGLGHPDRTVWAARLGSRGIRRSIGLPLLVTLGRHASSVVLGNVAAMRHLAVTANDPALVRRRLRAFALEAATSRTAGPLDVVVVGDTPPAGIEQLRQSDDPVVAIDAAIAEAEQELIAEDRLPRLVVYHDPSTAPDLPADLGFVGVVAASVHPPTSSWRLHLEDTRITLHTPAGDQFVYESPDLDPDLVDDQLATLDGAASSSHAEPEPALDSPAAEQAAPGWCDIGLLGPVTITCGGTPVETLAPIPRQVLVYLATHPGATSEQLENAVWAGRADTSGGQYRVRNALRRLRTELGNAPDGTPLVPRREPSSPMMHLPPAVTTDLDRAFAHLDAARSLDGDARLDRLLAALNLVRGAPFADLPVTWAADIEHQAIARLQDAAFAACETLLEAGRYDDAEHAVQQGLRLCDPCEPLYVLWARIEHARRQPHRIPQLWTRLRQRYAEDTDDTFDTPVAPTADTERAFAALLSRDTSSV